MIMDPSKSCTNVKESDVQPMELGDNFKSNPKNDEGVEESDRIKSHAVEEESVDSGISSSNDDAKAVSDCGEKQQKECTLRRSSRRKTRTTEGDLEYDLRTNTLVNRVQSERKRKEPKQPKPKAKPPPLSKYRRKTANARERGRMVEINVAFEELRNCLPNIEAGPASKLTKIHTLRLALNYISALRHTLGYDDDFNSDASSLRSSSVSSSSGDEQCLSPSDGELSILNSDDSNDLLSSDDTDMINSEELLTENLDLVQLDLDSCTDLLLS